MRRFACRAACWFVACAVTGTVADAAVVLNAPANTAPTVALSPDGAPGSPGARPPNAAAPSPSSPPPLKMDLNAFDAAKRVLLLPNGVHLAYIDMGDPKGPPVILIHGYTDNARDWVPLIPDLSRRYRLIVVDIRGHGRSDKPECCYARIDFAYDIKLLLDGLHIARADVVGHSLGSMITQVLAEEWPDRVRKVVLISSTGGPRPGSPPHQPAFDFAAQIRKLKEPIEPDSPFMIAWWDSPKPVDPDFIRRERIDSARIPLAVWLAVLDQGVNFSDLQRNLPKLQAPALLIWGSDDPIMEEEGRQTLREGLPSATVKVFAGLGHNPFWEDPQGVADVINPFLDGS
jgi:pimeloyl-ACP methyl ester carboxylesterase